MAFQLVRDRRDRQPGRVQRLEPIEEILIVFAALARDFRLQSETARR